ncbi:t-SNARE Ufe1, ER membrane fusion and vesicular traffic [Trichoderma guizhouense]|uniref:t-SNARE Ufe1, ER membrane fusion and vesicular traffic n=1 Tax=Trichoderma guizhouense TaxID=1491466 RepID=A0A1T3CBJ1_9HYPO|nr:t-SNARE Ufe1, ER membrane fusion and vesicular traffic [Trichoderma guizhouense]
MDGSSLQISTAVDITAQFNELLQQHKAPPVVKKVSLDDIDSFLKEAYRINSHITSLHQQLQDVRQAYLSTAQPRRAQARFAQNQPRILSDREREEVDANAKQMIRELNASIRSLDEAEQLRRETESAIIRKKYTKGLGALGSWASGGIASSKSAEHAAAEGQALQLGGYRDGVLWFLRQRLELVCRTQQEMMETRLRRELEKSRSMLPVGDLAEFVPTTHRSHQQPSGDAFHSGTDEYSVPATEGLTQEQVQMFEEGNQSMMEHYESTLDKVRTAERSLLEISELQTLLVNNLSAQSENIELLVADSVSMADNVGGGNKQLKKATQRPSTARYTFFAASGLCAFLILWDLII